MCASRLSWAALPFLMFLLAGTSGGQSETEVVPEPERLPVVEEVPNVTVPQDDVVTRLYNDAIKGVVRVEVPTTRTMGSGFVTSNNGVIVTNYHVIQGGQEAVVVFQDGVKREVQGVLVYDRSQDVAVLKVDPTGLSLHALALAEEGPPPNMTRILAIGHGQGFDFTATEGRVMAAISGKELQEQMGWHHMNLGPDSRWIRISAQIWHGNSGGPSLTHDGKVVGVNTLAGPPLDDLGRPTGAQMYFAACAVKLRQIIMERGATEPTPLKTVAEREKDKVIDYGCPGMPGSIGGWIPDRLYKQMDVGQAISALRAELRCPKCRGTGSVKAKQVKEYQAAPGMVYKEVTTHDVVCGRCWGRQVAWSERAYARAARLAKRAVLLDKESCPAEAADRLRGALHEVFQSAAVNAAADARLCNRLAVKVLSNPDKEKGEPVVFYGLLSQRVAYGAEAVLLVTVYGSGQVIAVYCPEHVQALKGQYCLVAGVCVGRGVFSVQGGSVEWPKVYACAVESIR